MNSTGCDVNKQNATGQTPLHYAASKSFIAIGKKLLENGAHPAVQDQIGSTPLHRAASKGC